METLNTSLGGTPSDPISSLLLMLETPEQMVVVCTAGTRHATGDVITLSAFYGFFMIQGPGKEIYQVGMGGDKGHEGSEEKLYCQVSCQLLMQYDY